VPSYSQLDKAAADAAEFKAGFDKLTADTVEQRAQLDKVAADAAEYKAGYDKALMDAVEQQAQLDKATADAAEFKAGYDKLSADTVEQKAQVWGRPMVVGEVPCTRILICFCSSQARLLVSARAETAPHTPFCLPAARQGRRRRRRVQGRLRQADRGRGGAEGAAGQGGRRCRRVQGRL
jgi:hypothetical protein